MTGDQICFNYWDSQKITVMAFLTTKKAENVVFVEGIGGNWFLGVGGAEKRFGCQYTLSSHQGKMKHLYTF